MIKFQQLKYKNFLSTGDQWTTIDLESVKSTLIVGQNGSGKSTMLDALSFALFGKAHRNVNKPQLVNSINGKGCLVEVDFVALGKKYKVVRGLKPVKFEIWQDSTMINQDSHAKEYQKILEQNILKLNHKSFHQIVVLGSSSFIPFMQLPAQHRREVIEDLLDINVFSKMNSLLKEKVSVLKDKVSENGHSISLADTKISSQEKNIRELEKLGAEAKAEKEETLARHLTKIEEIEERLDESIKKQYKILEKEWSKAGDKKAELEKYQTMIGNKRVKNTQALRFYENNDTCPSCDQEITVDTKDRKIAEINESEKELEAGTKNLAKELESVKSIIDDVQTRYLDAGVHVKNQENYQLELRNEKRYVEGLRAQISKCGEGSESLQQAKVELQDLLTHKSKLVDDKMLLAEEREYNNVITEMLKDSGIKTKIIKQYLPVINKLTNQYLQVLDFYVHFDLDEGFNETIRSRHRDVFSYSSFSEGEKQRIDLALLFTWRQVARMKNSVATNLLILDETFDSSLDADGVENLLKILDTLDDETNVFIISHKGELLDNKFERKIEFTKSKNFSKII